MPVQVKLNTPGVVEGHELGEKGLVLGSITLCSAAIDLGAGGGGGAGAGPLVRPVSIDVGAHARYAATCLAVLSPETFRACVDEACRTISYPIFKCTIRQLTYRRG